MKVFWRCQALIWLPSLIPLLGKLVTSTDIVRTVFLSCLCILASLLGLIGAGLGWDD